MTIDTRFYPDDENTDVYKIARAVYAETGASSLRAVQAMCAMIANVAIRTGRSAVDVACDANVIPAQAVSSPRHDGLNAPVASRGFQMCLRVARRMLCGGLDDVTHGATCFHHDDELPDWAVARGYIAEIDGMLFYL